MGKNEKRSNEYKSVASLNYAIWFKVNHWLTEADLVFLITHTTSEGGCGTGLRWQQQDGKTFIQHEDEKEFIERVTELLAEFVLVKTLATKCGVSVVDLGEMLKTQTRPQWRDPFEGMRFLARSNEKVFEALVHKDDADVFVMRVQELDRKAQIAI